jgi:hypothetical protein
VLLKLASRIGIRKFLQHAGDGLSDSSNISRNPGLFNFGVDRVYRRSHPLSTLFLFFGCSALFFLTNA